MNKHGSVLIEALLAVVIMAVSMTALIQALMTNLNAGLTQQKQAKALFAMEEKIERKFFFESAP